jgi:spore germination protein YaaH
MYNVQFNVMKRFFFAIVFLFVGVIVGGLLIVLTGILPLRYDNPFIADVGIVRPQIVGFMPYWLLDKAASSYGKNLTTYSYFGLIVGSDGHIVKLNNPREEEPGWATLTSDKLKKSLDQAKKDGLKLSLLVQSGDEDAIETMMTDPVTNADNLMSDVGPIMKDYGFTDLNLDIESVKNTSPSAQIPFNTFAAQVKKHLDQEQLGTLSVDLVAYSLIKTRLTNPADLAKIADYIILMTYDYFYSGSYLAGPVAPVGGAGVDKDFDVESAVKEALRIMPGEKIILGIPLYGYEWETIASSSGSPVIPNTGMTASNRRVTDKLKNCQDCISGVDATGGEPYVIFPDGDVYHQIYYENIQSLAAKLDLAKKYHLGGTALWALGYESDTMLSPLEEYKRWWFLKSD